MRVHSLKTFRLGDHRSEAEKFTALGPIAERHGRILKGARLPTTQVPACPRVKVSELPGDHIPRHYFERLEHDQKLASCCRHPENHEIEALKSHPAEEAPDIYVFHCTCGRKHRRFCLGNGDRPFWAAEVA